jgi:endoglucanase
MPSWTRPLIFVVAVLLCGLLGASAWAQSGDPCDPQSPLYDPDLCYTEPPAEEPQEPIRPLPPRPQRPPSLPDTCAPLVSAVGDAQATSPSAQNPLVDLSWFIDKEWGMPWRKYLAARGEKKRLIYKIASHPQFKWFGKWDLKYGSMGRAVRLYLKRVHCSGTVAQIATFLTVAESCHARYQGGGRRADGAFRRNIKSLAEGIGNHRVVIAYEPDSLGTVSCLARGRRKARLNNLRYGVDLLSKLPNATVYIEGEAPNWEGARTVAKKLRYVGVRKVRGFMLNVTHMATTGTNLRFGAKLSRLTGGKHFIVNTSDNGNGQMWMWRGGKRLPVWCNPPNSALGTPATTTTGHPKADGFFWINRPGVSHGACNGGPSSGSWWEKRALAMARRARF